MFLQLGPDKKKNKLLLISVRRCWQLSPAEEENNNDFAKHISNLGDIFVNDAFSCSHRNHSSICQIPKFIPSYSGLQLNSELYALKKLTSNIQKPIQSNLFG